MPTLTTTLDPTFVADWSQRFLDAWNALDAEAVAALCTEDVIWRDPSEPEPLTGRAAVASFVRKTARTFPDFHVEETAGYGLVPNPERVLAPYRMTGTMLGPMDAFAPTGRTIAIDGVDEWTFRDELLSGYFTYYDTLDAARQLGIVPAAGSRAEQAMSRLQHVQARFQRRTAHRSAR